MTVGDVAAIILNAGRSRRMGHPKGNLLFRDGMTFIERAVQLARTGNDWRFVVIVSGPEGVSPEPADKAVVVATNPSPDRGMFSSIKPGVAAALAKTPELSGLLLLLIDHPLVCDSTVTALTEAHRSIRGMSLVPTYEGRTGHPVLLSRTLLDAIEEADASLAARKRDLEAREADLVAARLEQQAAGLRVTAIDTEIKALDALLDAASATGNALQAEELAASKARAGEVRGWRVERKRVAARAVAVAQRSVGRAKAEVKVAEAELQRAKLAAWVDLGAGPEVDTALAKASRVVARTRRALGQQDRRLERAEDRMELAQRAADSVKPADDERVRTAEAEQRVADLQSELEEAGIALGDERAARDRLAERLAAAREQDAAEPAVVDRSAELAAAEQAAAEARAQVQERDAMIDELRAELAADDPIKAQETAAMGAEIASLQAERDRLAELARLLEEQRDTAVGRAAESESRLEEVTEAVASADARSAEQLRMQEAGHLQQLAHLGGQADAVAAERDALAERVAALESGDPTAASRDGQLVALRQRLEDAERLSAERVAALERELEGRAEEVARAEERLAAATAESERLATALAGERARSADDILITDDTDFAARVAELESRLSQALLRTAAAEAELATAESDQRDAVEAARSEAAVALDAERTKVREAEAALADASQALQAAGQAALAATDEAATLRAALEDTADAAAVLDDERQGRLEALQEERDDLQTELRELRMALALQVEALERQVSEAVLARDETAARLELREARVTELTEAVDAAEQGRRGDAAEASAELSAARGARDGARARLAEVEAELREARRKLARIEGENAELWARLDGRIEWNASEGDASE